ncbi:MAG: peptide ABC transporter substrate-binding protein [Candidatus Eremiobacteraeota bacterium]|nr:peptide ABC transporter substrate-binding protein [Candidatus Eremiobacteraeota bacterium]
MKKLCAIALLLALAACTKVGTQGNGGTSGTGTAQPHHLRIADGSGDIDSLNPHLFQEVPLGNIAELTMAWLLRFDHNNRAVPELATAVPTQKNGGISADGKTITYHIRKGVKWSDGAPFNADDVVFSTNAVNNPANNEVGRDGWELIKKIDEPDKYTVVYHLLKPYAAYQATFFGTGGANPCVLPKHILGNLPNINKAPYNAKPVGIGPFRVTAWRRGDAVEMEANPYYWRGRPKLERITYKLVPSRDTLATQMQSGDVDLWPLVPAAFIDAMKKVQTATTVVVPSYYYSHLDFQNARPLVSDLRVRQAIRYAIDRKAIVEKIGHGYGVLQDSVISPANPMAAKDASFTPYDPAKAKELLDQAGWKTGSDGIRVKNGERLSLSFPFYTGSPEVDREVELMRSMLKAAGIDIQTRKSSAALFFAQYQDNGINARGNWDITTYKWGGTPEADLSALYACNRFPPAGQNYIHYCNKQVSAWMDQFKATYDDAIHRDLDAKIVKQIAADVPTIVLYVLQDGFTYNKQLKGYSPNQVSPFDDMMNVDI